MAGRADPGPAPPVLGLPPALDLVTMLVALAAVSTSGPLMAATAAPPLAIAFWRNGLAAAVLTPWTLARHRVELRALSARERRLAVAAGVLLALHFATWVPSLSLTKVSSATALVSSQPIWAALLARRAGADIPRRAWVGILLAVVGAAVVTGADVSTSWRALGGDVLAVLGGMSAAGYIGAGGEVRRHVSTATYTTVCYATAALALLASCLVGGQPLAGYPAGAWLRLVAITAGAQFLGHSLFNRVLATTSPTVVSLAILFEVPGATLLAAVFLHQRPTLVALPGLALLLAGLGMVVVTRDRRGEPAIPVE